MKRSTLLSSMLLVCLSQATMAGNFYLGSSAVLQTITAKNSNYFGIHPTFSVGYGGMGEKYYWSGEIFVIPVAGTIATSISHFGVNTKTTYGYGASFIPGMPFGNHRLGFLRLGFITSNFPGLKASRSGTQLGAGVRSPLSKKWDWRIEYIYTTYQTAAGLNSAKSNELALGLIYNFEPMVPKVRLTYK